MSSDLHARMHTYLAEIYRLADHVDDEYVSTSALAEKVDVSAPAVNRMVNRLKELGMLQHEPYQGIQLTQQGKEEALKHIRMHRIAEAFLVKVMDMSWDEIYTEATQLSNAMNEKLTQRMYEMAGEPTICPHGEPIPQVDGSIVPMNDILLSTITEAKVLEITRLLTRESDRLQYLEALGLLPGTQFEVLHVAPFNGPMQLKVDNEYRIIGHNLAELIRVRER